ncbi:hypothetical protein SJ05684_b47070 (plasmid) [Sinorhizobium sojae CCBAU 05684]|uniref:Secreted protein n=1 Tax=Sinorhizobium sojae CCBAU 05684 TaxID=716928 RepID=A0A249PK45_9HYPH|nr:hypothetical protein [Sinorhizobium sojae]ASY65689.1 hypothetical protein SJ05684_b47070 [Sinorhizobium sojae CCBAU 05684]
MTQLIRLLAVVLVALLAAGTVVHTQKATAMSAAVSTAVMTDADMDDCDECPPADEGRASSCIDFCLGSFAAIPATALVELPFTTPDSAVSSSDDLDGRAVPPDPFPPRSIIL